jgi:hypothetical protein
VKFSGHLYLRMRFDPDSARHGERRKAKHRDTDHDAREQPRQLQS